MPCCGDATCGDVETHINCPADCETDSADGSPTGDASASVDPYPESVGAEKVFVLDNAERGASRLFGDKVKVVVEHPTYHCHQTYEDVRLP